MPPLDDGLDREAPKGLDERVLLTLHGLPGRIAFSGLRRALHAHPESLSRSLRRLEREGRVDRGPDGYRLTATSPEPRTGLPGRLRSVGQVFLPPGTDAENVLGRLAGRWFGSLRWVGVVDAPDGRLLAWARRDGSGSVLLGVRGRLLRVYLRDGASAEDLGDGEDSAYELLVHALDVLRPPPAPPSVGPVSFLSADPTLSGLGLDN